MDELFKALADANRRKCEEANKMIAKLDDHQHIFFTDINSKFLDDQGGLIGFRGGRANAHRLTLDHPCKH